MPYYKATFSDGHTLLRMTTSGRPYTHCYRIEGKYSFDGGQNEVCNAHWKRHGFATSARLAAHAQSAYRRHNGADITFAEIAPTVEITHAEYKTLAKAARKAA